MRVGILGGGQLGCMLAESLLTLGAQVRFFEPSPLAPALARYAGTTCAPFNDTTALSAFFSACDVVTYESENVPLEPLRALGELGQKLRPGLDVLRISQDRAEEKTFFTKNRLPCARTLILDKIGDLPAAASDMGFPFVLKTARGGYDGKGQWKVRGLAELGGLAPLRQGAPGRFVIEELVDLRAEVSVIVGRKPTAQGDAVSLFPVFENHHHDHILDLTQIPAHLSERQRALLCALAIKTARDLDLEGLLTIEFFLSDRPGAGTSVESDGLHIRINELAPRPHNSGHLTRKACTISQFDQLARLLVGLPPATPHLHEGGWAMAQLLGKVWGSRKHLDLSTLVDHPAVVEVMDYGKTEVRPARKMGHLIAMGANADEAVDFALRARHQLTGSLLS
ncbi:MAG: ATP-grasp domain-containing protein [Deltaproteobacteria bacterium]|nr:MAG: ATP-grasp domain-containing protein [Deltaproteobacteria bacterium]